MSPRTAPATPAGGRKATKAGERGGLARPPGSSSRVAGRASGRHAVRTVRRAAAPRIARRVSGPAGGRAAAAVALPRAPLAPLGPRLVAFASSLPDRGFVDRMVRGRAWIAVVATLLIGLVAMQVSLLKLNAGIGRAVERGGAVERANGVLRAQVSRLESGERIQQEAAALGMVMPPAGQISYVRARDGGDVAAAVSALEQGRFNDPAQTIALPGTADPPDPLESALTQQAGPAAAGEEGDEGQETVEESGEEGVGTNGEEGEEGEAATGESGEESSSSGSGEEADHEHEPAQTAAIGGGSEVPGG